MTILKCPQDNGIFVLILPEEDNPDSKPDETLAFMPNIKGGKSAEQDARGGGGGPGGQF